MVDPSTPDSAPAVNFNVEGRAGHAVIERAGRLNALSPDVIEGLSACIEQATEQGLPVLTIRGSGGTISAGADLPFLRSILRDADAVRAYITSIGAMLDRLEAAPFISVCVLDGYALAGGCEILLACDLAVVSDRSRIGDRHLEYGLLPGAGGSVRLSRALPPALARRLLYTAEIVDGTTAGQLGLVSHVAPAAELDTTAGDLVTRLCRHDPQALERMKRLHQEAVTSVPAVARATEREILLRHLTGPAAAEGLAAFAERRQPVFAAGTGTGTGTGAGAP